MDIICFGFSKDITGKKVLEIPAHQQPDSVAGLKNWLNKTYPAFLGKASYGIAVNQDFATDDKPIGKEDEIAIIPPICGG